MRKILVHGDQYFKACVLRSGDEFPVGEPLETREAARLALVTFEMMTERFIDALIQQDTNLAAGKKRLFGFFERLHGRFPSDCGKPLQESLRL